MTVEAKGAALVPESPGIATICLYREVSDDSQPVAAFPLSPAQATDLAGALLKWASSRSIPV